MSEIQSAEDFIDSVWDIVHCAGGPFTERSGRKQISDLLEADRAAHIALGREMERKRFEACVKALENALVAVKPDATRLYRESMQRKISKALADLEATK